jgi:hypothetical protein
MSDSACSSLYISVDDGIWKPVQHALKYKGTKLSNGRVARVSATMLLNYPPKRHVIL